jgi:polyisoprenoid-binding protein YceI
MASPTVRSSRQVSLANAVPGRWDIDPARSSVHLEYRTMWGLALVRGSFATVTGAGELTADGRARCTVTVAAASLDTGDVKRDARLRSEEFLDAARHPAITFTTTRVTATGDSTVEVAGEVTVRGITRPAVFPARATHASADAVTVVAGIPVDHQEFGMARNVIGLAKDATIVTIMARFLRRQP